MKKVLKYITRKTLLYKTGVEYGDYTINHIRGCSHGCLYPCYAFMMAKRFGTVKSYEEWLEPCLVSNTISILNSEIPKLKDKINSVQLCFTTDPFMYEYDEITSMSLEIISLLNKAEIKCSVLTKGVLPKELATLSKENEYGITLVSLDENFRQNYEPNTAIYDKRIDSLRYLNEKGYKTWVSIEPYPTPNIIEQDFQCILNSISFVDKIIFGKLNYNSKVSQYSDYKKFYNLLSKQVVDFCEDNSKEHYIKKGTMYEVV